MQQCQRWSPCWVSCWWFCQRGSCLLQEGVSQVTGQQSAEKTFILLHWFVAVARKHLVHILEICFGCSYLSSTVLPYNSSVKGIVPSIHISGSVCQPVLWGCTVTLIAGATTVVTFGWWQDGSVLRGMKFPCNVILPCVWAAQVSLREEFPTDAVFPVLLLASGQPDISMLVEGAECWALMLVVQGADGWLSFHRIICFLSVFLTTRTLKFTMLLGSIGTPLWK